MADSAWWFNRLGDFAPASNPGSSVPDYSLTLDVGTAPWDKQGFNALMSSGPIKSNISAPKPQPQGGGSIWDHVMDAVHGAEHVVGGVTGGLDVLGNKLGFDWTHGNHYDEYAKKAKAEGLHGWDYLKAIGGSDFGRAVKEDSNAPVAKQVFWGLSKASEYTGSQFVAATEAQKMYGDWGALGHYWGPGSKAYAKGHALVNKYHLNAGESFAQMFYNDEVIDDQKRFDQIRQHSTVFNTGALAFNTIAAWKFDPNVLAGKGLGAVKDFRRGALADGGKSAAIQRNVLSQSTREAAQQAARSTTGVANRVRAQYAMTLWDKKQAMFDAADRLGAEDFQNLAPFRNSASGPVLARLIQETSGADRESVFRAAIGDPTALADLASRRGEVADKLKAIEARGLPNLESQYKRVLDRYNKRVAEQGRTEAEGLKVFNQSDWLLDQSLRDAATDYYATADQLSAYEHYDSWLQRATAGYGKGNGADANAITGLLDSLNPKSPVGSTLGNTLYALGGKVRTFRHDEYSPVARVFHAPLKPFLKRVSAVNLNNVDEGGDAIGAYLDQIAYITGAKDQGMRDHVFARWGSSASDVERSALAQELERQGLQVVFKKHGLSEEAGQKVIRDLQKKRAQTWATFSDRTRYTTAKDPKTGKSLDLFAFKNEDGTVNHVRMPMDPSELKDWYALTNLTDLDHTLRLHRDLLAEADRYHYLVKKGLASQRTLENAHNVIGEALNSVWKPLQLLSIRWPARVVGDESLRVMLLLGPMAHMRAWGKQATNVLYNQGLARPSEWWNGRKLDMGSISDDSLRTDYGQFDPFDHRQADNPTGAVRADSAAFGEIDPKRYDKLNEAVSKREQYIRKVEAQRANTAEAGKKSARMAQAVETFMEPNKPAWAQRWDDRLAAAEQSDARGFFMDPVSHKANNKGFAVSVYPGRMRTFDHKPTARELNFWTKQNSDILAIPKNRVAVWLDKETGRWHLDVVRRHARREDAMQEAARSGAEEFYDINQGFTRFMSNEDPFQHYYSPFFGETPESAFASEIQAANDSTVDPTTGEPVPTPPRPRFQRRGLLYGKRKWRSLDGQTVESEGFGGQDIEDPNVWVSTIGSGSAFKTLFGGYTKGLGRLRAAQPTGGYKVFHADDPTDTAGREAWAHAWTHYVNHHIRMSPIWRRMLNGQSDHDIINWLYSAEGRKLRTRMGPRGWNPHKWVTDMRAVFDHTLPTREARLAARDGEVSPDQVDNLIPFEQRNDIHGQEVESAAGTHMADGMWRAFVSKAYHVLGSMPTDHLVRHPFASNLYDMRMRNYLSSIPREQITPEVLAAAEAASRQFALKQVKKYLYNLADEYQGVHALRFLAPFFAAQIEVANRYARIWTEHPDTVAHTLQLYLGSQQIHNGIYQIQDQNGNQVHTLSKNHNVVVQITPFMRSIANHIPGLKTALSQAGSISIPEGSMDLIFNGEGAKSFLPSMGPLATIPASEFYFKKHPFATQNAVFNWMFPYGTPKSVTDGLLPAWGRRLHTALMNDFNDSAYANRANQIYEDMQFAYEHGKLDKKPTAAAAMHVARAEMFLRAASSFFMPVPISMQSPHQFWIDQARKFQSKYGVHAMDKFYNTYGPDLFRFYSSSTKSTDGLAPTIGQAKGYFAHKSLIDQAPDLAGVIAGPVGKGPDGQFNYEVYKWQLGQRKSPLSKDTIRELQSPEQMIQSSQVDQGWIEYSKLSSAIDAELRNRYAAGQSYSLNASSNADLARLKKQKIQEIMQRNPAWQEAYINRDDKLATWLNQAYKVAFDPSLNGRKDIQGLRAYLYSRANLQQALQERYMSGQSTSTTLSGVNPITGQYTGDNQDLAAGWDSYVKELCSKNPLFAEIYHRYLEGDDMSVMVTQ